MMSESRLETIAQRITHEICTFFAMQPLPKQETWVGCTRIQYRSFPGDYQFMLSDRFIMTLGKEAIAFYEDHKENYPWMELNYFLTTKKREYFAFTGEAFVVFEMPNDYVALEPLIMAKVTEKLPAPYQASMGASSVLIIKAC